MAGSERKAFGDYVRLRRAHMPAPEPAAGRRASQRRVPGLRRQEVAALAGISVEYYTRLEQGRAPRPSREILTALARAFGLTDPERDHLFRLAGEAPPHVNVPDASIRPGLLRLLRGLDDTMPVTIHDGRLDLLAQNAPATELLGPLLGDGPYGRNIVYQAFTTPALPTLLGDDGAALLLRIAATELRTALSRYPEDNYLRSILAELTAREPKFCELWDQVEVSAWRSAIKSMHHPRQGWIEYDIEMLHDPDRDHWIMLYTPQRKA